MKVGMLVKTSDWRYITLYPDEETANEIMYANLTDPARKVAWAQKHGVQIHNLTEDVPLLVLRMGEDPRFVEVLAGDKKGWMIKYPTMIFRRVK